MPKQRPILFEFNSDLTFDDYFVGDNEEIITHLQQAAILPDSAFIYLWGAAGLGKSHLLQACSQLARVHNKQVFFLALQHQNLPALEILERLETFQLVCIDNIQVIAGNHAWEEAIFGLFNQIRELKGSLIVSANHPVTDINLQLPDLKTRLAWGLVLKLKDLNETHKIQALSHKARQSGFEINPKVGQYLINHYSRDFPALWRLLNILEHETLAEKRKLTIPFLKQILEQIDMTKA